MRRCSRATRLRAACRRRLPRCRRDSRREARCCRLAEARIRHRRSVHCRGTGPAPLALVSPVRHRFPTVRRRHHGCLVRSPRHRTGCRLVDLRWWLRQISWSTLAESAGTIFAVSASCRGGSGTAPVSISIPTLLRLLNRRRFPLGTLREWNFTFPSSEIFTSTLLKGNALVVRKGQEEMQLLKLEELKEGENKLTPHPPSEPSESAEPAESALG